MTEAVVGLKVMFDKLDTNVVSSHVSIFLRTAQLMFTRALLEKYNAMYIAPENTSHSVKYRNALSG